jgi:hypothetical protein
MEHSCSKKTLQQAVDESSLSSTVRGVGTPTHAPARVNLNLCLVQYFASTGSLDAFGNHNGLDERFYDEVTATEFAFDTRHHYRSSAVMETARAIHASQDGLSNSQPWSHWEDALRAAKVQAKAEDLVPLCCRGVVDDGDGEGIHISAIDQPGVVRQYYLNDELETSLGASLLHSVALDPEGGGPVGGDGGVSGGCGLA